MRSPTTRRCCRSGRDVTNCSRALPGLEVMHKTEQSEMSLTRTAPSWSSSNVVSSMSPGVGEQAGKDLLIGGRNAGPGLTETLAIRILADGQEQFAHRGLGAADVEIGEGEHLRDRGDTRGTPSQRGSSPDSIDRLKFRANHARTVSFMALLSPEPPPVAARVG